MGVTFGPGMVRALEARLAEVTAERDRLREFARWARPVCEYVSIGRGGVDQQPDGARYPDAAARRALGVLADADDKLAATPLSASAEDRAATDGAGSAPSRAQGPHDAIGDPHGGSAEGTLPAPKDDTIDDGFGNAWVRCGSDCDMHVVRPGKAQCNAGGVNCPTKEARP